MILKKYLPQITISVLVLAAYWNCLHNHFVWDDEFLIQKNTYLHSFSNLPKMLVSNSTAGFGGVDNFYRPTQNIYYLFIYQLFGQSEVAFHMGNILLHLINGILMFLVLVRLLNDRTWAFVASALWVSHPTHVEAIGYISGTADPMGFLFFFLGLWILPFDNFKTNWKSLLGAWLCFVLSILSKEAMIVVPALLILVLGLKNPQRRWHWQTYIPTLPFWVTAGLYMLARKTILNFNNTYNFFKTSNIYTENMLYRLYTYLATLPEYVEILFYPVNLHMERAFPVHTKFTSTPVLLGSALIIVTLTFSLVAFFKQKKSWPLFSWLWFFGAFVPMMGVLVPVNSFILEHWLYLPSVGFFIVLARIFYFNRPTMPGVSKGLVIAACLYFAVFTHIRNKDWRTPISFYSNILQYSEGSARVHNNIAMAYSEKKDYQKAIAHYLEAIEQADAYPQTHYNLARAYIQLQQYDKAVQHLQRSLQINPNFRYASELLQNLQSFLKQNQ